MIYAFTGHRPHKLGGYSSIANLSLKQFALRWMSTNIGEEDVIITGMAIGWDQAVAWAALSLGIPYIAAIPFIGQERLWPWESRCEYSRLLESATGIEVVVKTPLNVRWDMHCRNMWMVDNCDKLIALWDGTGGGTRNCIEYAEKTDTEWVNLWSRWVKRPSGE